MILESAVSQKWFRDLPNLCKYTIILRSSLSSLDFPIVLRTVQIQSVLSNKSFLCYYKEKLPAVVMLTNKALKALVRFKDIVEPSASQKICESLDPVNPK